ncbi:acylphosphatase [Shewanella sp. NFH-SH190041]|uniref:acylphosphatase n=1 Tax=Shewanella sp. NFH-SH190041 TaxID=2950245 RepID=UPI0021C33214|nr:acylphosphatase [Shewanella sp. NFH-SH190041]BDM63957.1 acylphosphatase [Shewanella sp. NFH-SH190041]
MKRVVIYITGHVQGVGFRRATQAKANALRLTGYVINRADGQVEILAQGGFPAVDELINWCWNGVAGAQVSNVLVEDDEADDIYLDFSIVAL